MEICIVEHGYSFRLRRDQRGRSFGSRALQRLFDTTYMKQASFDEQRRPKTRRLHAPSRVAVANKRPRGVWRCGWCKVVHVGLHLDLFTNDPLGHFQTKHQRRGATKPLDNHHTHTHSICAVSTRPLCCPDRTPGRFPSIEKDGHTTVLLIFF